MTRRTMPRGMKLYLTSKASKLFQDGNVWLYRKSGGKLGARLMGAPLLLLSTRGRKTGKQRVTPLIYHDDGGALAVVASKGGWPTDPLWYRNLQADGAVEVQVGRDVRPMLARTADAEERARLWPKLVALYAAYADYQSWSEREIPVVVLTPRA
jgi:deazaflavin-dependent oxidoreductase (nitroreductase family)